MASQTLTWDVAEEDCQANGGHLVTINSRCKNELVLDYVRRTSLVTDGRFPSDNIMPVCEGNVSTDAIGCCLLLLQFDST